TALRQLVDQARNCSVCPRMAGRGGALRFVGPRARRPVMFVAEAPGRLGAARTGLPLHGDATGRNFEWLLDEVGWTRADVWVTNAVLCWPEGEGGVNDRPSREEIDACGGFLRRQLEIVDPLVVAPLGLVALEALGRLAPVERGPMSALASKAQKWEGRLLMPLFHPSPRVTNTRRSLELQVNDMLALRALVDRQVALGLEGTVAH
ncbi:MAG: uracil-DNA glycosylase, partial [Gaiellaceae bacterium]